MLIGYFLRHKIEPEEQVSLDLGNARSAYIKINHGAGQLILHGGAPAGKLLSGSCHGGLDLHSEISGEKLDVKLHTPSQFWDWAPGAGLDWNLAFSNEVPLKIKIESGASASSFDFTDLLLTDLKVETGASSTEIKMPVRAGNTMADIDTGVSSLKLIVPEGVSARIRIKGGLSAINVNTTRFPLVEGKVYQSSDYTTAVNRLDLTVDAGVGAIDIV
jgi:hypothetical protein